MPERDRPSLTGLSIKRPLPDRGKPVVTLDEAETALLGTSPAATPAAPSSGFAAGAAAPAPAPAQAPELPSAILSDSHIDDHTTVQPAVLSPTLLKARKKEIKIAWTFKIPHSLHQELSTVAAHNGLTMSDIVIEAIRFHLPNFPHPPSR